MNKSAVSKGAIAGAVIIVLLAVVLLLPKKSASAPTAQNPAAVVVSTSTATDPSNPSASPYKDGTYTASGSYLSPGGEDGVTVTLTLANGVITDANVVSGANDKTSAHYQGIFIANYKPLVIGKNIDDVNLSKVSGSSLTSGGFNQALAQIKTEASA